MGRDVSKEIFRKEKRKEESVRELDSRFLKFGYRYLGAYPDFLGSKPYLCERATPFNPIKQLGLSEARAVLKRWENGSLAPVLVGGKRYYPLQHGKFSVRK